MPADPSPDPDVLSRLDLRADGTGRARRRRWPWVVAALVLLAGVGVAVVLLRGPAAAPYTTATVQAGSLREAVTAVGQVEPRHLVAVASESSGIVATVLVDTNDHVTAGQALAELDDTLTAAQVAQARAQLEAARAQAKQAASIAAEARRALERSDKAGRVAQSDEQMDRARFAAAQAEAASQAADAQVAAARAGLDIAEATLAKTVIRAPIDGVVLERHVEPGQAVVSALAVAELFSIAESLSRMTVRVEIDEADVGRVRPGQPATFTVAAWPHRRFEAVVQKVEPSPRTAGQVVSYEAELDVDNSDGALLPGMTATASIVAAVHDQELLVPHAALRWAPEDAEEDTVPRVWVLRDGTPQPVQVTRIATEAAQVAVASDALRPGDVVVTGLESGQ